MQAGRIFHTSNCLAARLPPVLQLLWLFIALPCMWNCQERHDSVSVKDRFGVSGIGSADAKLSIAYDVQPQPSWDYQDRLFSRQVPQEVRVGGYQVTYPLFFNPRRIPIQGDTTRILPGDIIADSGLSVVFGPEGHYSQVESSWYIGTGGSRWRLDFTLGTTTLQRLNELSDIHTGLAEAAHWFYLPLAPVPHRILVSLIVGNGVERWTAELLARFEAIDPKRYCLDMDARWDGIVPAEAPLPEEIECLVIAGKDTRKGWQFASGQLGSHPSTVDFVIAPLRRLRYLRVSSTGHLDMATIANNHELEFLEVHRNVPMANVSAMGRLRNLRALSLKHKEKLTNLDFLAGLHELRFLDVTGVGATSLRPIETLRNLVEVHADESGIAELPRRVMPKLQVLHVMSQSLPAREVKRFARLNPHVKIWHSFRGSSGALLQGVDRIKINEIEITEGAEIARLGSILNNISDGASGWDCRCYGRPWLEFFKGEERVATLAVYHGVAIRWREEWPSGVFLGYEGSRMLVDWLESHCVSEPKRERQEYFELSPP